MGIIHHHAVLVTCSKDESSSAIQAWVDALDNRRMAALFVKVPTVINGYDTWIMAPDGSKLGWNDSKDAAEIRDLFIKALPEMEKEPRVWFKWVEVSYGELGQRVEQGNCGEVSQ